jgi:hypothetical protein
MQNSHDKKNDQSDSDLSPKPDKATQNTSDPQDNMKGPFSSAMHQTGEAFETEETKAEADEDRDTNV